MAHGRRYRLYSKNDGEEVEYFNTGNSFSPSRFVFLSAGGLLVFFVTALEVKSERKREIFPGRLDGDEPETMSYEMQNYC